MSAKHALLGLLLHRPAYPYALAKRLEDRMGPAGAINPGYLSRTMRQLEGEGQIERVGGAAAKNRGGRHVFAITEDGAEEFERWFAESPNVTRLSRGPLQIKITLAGPERLRDALEQIDAYERDCAARVKELSSLRDEVDPGEGPQIRADCVLFRLNLSADIIQLEGELRWANHAHEMISWLLSREAIWPSATERSSALTDKARDRRDAREKLFGRIAARAPRPVSARQGRDRDR
jgi:DNA-binding PadR family transcriptional regulator